jgi:hypothetical protein
MTAGSGLSWDTSPTPPSPVARSAEGSRSSWSAPSTGGNVMNMTQDDDAPRHLRVVRAAPPRPPKTRGADAAARYRARKRGEPVPKRKPGPKRKTNADLRLQIRDRDTRIKELELYRRILEERLGRRLSTLTVEQVARELLDVLRRDPPERDQAERRVLLGDVVAEIESRHEYWPE